VDKPADCPLVVAAPQRRPLVAQGDL